MISVDDLLGYQQRAATVYVDPEVVTYAVKLALATRAPGEHGLEQLAGYIDYGASPRGSINLIHAARAYALLHGRGYALPQDVRALAKDVLCHRLVLSYRALAEEVTADSLLDSVLAAVEMPRIDLAREAA